MLEFLVALGLVAIIAAIIQDFRTREVANWLNFSVLISALVFRIFYSTLTESFNFLFFGLFGLTISFILAYLMYYGRLFAGGDAKLFIALGAVIPFANNFRDNNLIFLVFLIVLLFGGAIYSLIYSYALAFLNWKSFSKEFNNLYKKNISNFYAILAFSLVFIIYTLISWKFVFLIFPGFLVLLFFLYIYAKSVEKSCMLKRVSPIDIRIGDWLEREITVKDKTIKPNWEGLSVEEVELIKKHHKEKIIIKDGIPFTPAFLIAFLVIVYIQFFMGGNWGFWGIF